MPLIASIGLTIRQSGSNSRRLGSPTHAELRMEQRGVTEVYVRAMLKRATGFEPSVVEGPVHDPRCQGESAVDRDR